MARNRANAPPNNITLGSRHGHGQETHSAVKRKHEPATSAMSSTEPTPSKTGSSTPSKVGSSTSTKVSSSTPSKASVCITSSTSSKDDVGSLTFVPVRPTGGLSQRTHSIQLPSRTVTMTNLRYSIEPGMTKEFVEWLEMSSRECEWNYLGLDSFVDGDDQDSSTV